MSTTETHSTPAGTWSVDKVHSNVGFAVAYMAGTFSGTFSDFDAAVTDGVLLVEGPGKGTVANLAGNTAVTLVFPPREPRGFTLLVDGTATVSGEDVRVTPTGAVLHRAGTADVATGAPLRASDSMWLASVSKAFNGAVALSLVADGRLSLGDTVGRRLPGLPLAWSKVTLRELLQHTSGIPDYIASPRFQQAFVASLQDPPPPRDLLGFIDDPALLFAPGTQYRYSNSDNIVVGLMVQAATGRAYADVLRALVLGPAHLTATSLPVGSALPSPYLHGKV